MQLLNVNRAQAVWLFDVNDLNPRGKFFLPELLEWLKETYNFQQSPKSVNDLDETKGLTFKQGAFHMGDDLLTVEVAIYNDGLIANTYSSTHATDVFLQNLLYRASSEFELNYNETIIRSKTHLSELTVQREEPLAKLNPNLAKFADLISQAHGYKFEVGGISFWPDVSGSALKPAPFQIERRLNAPFSENRFYTKAPLHTDKHLELLEVFDQLLKS
jgi:hypothetical protein